MRSCAGNLHPIRSTTDDYTEVELLKTADLVTLLISGT